MLLNPGTVLSGRYEILEKIGSGGMGSCLQRQRQKAGSLCYGEGLLEGIVGTRIN